MVGAGEVWARAAGRRAVAGGWVAMVWLSSHLVAPGRAAAT
jgi:hypothetical protein